jgi:hypothetical protein
MGNLVSLRDKLRSATLGAPAVHESETVDWGGEKYEVRRLTLAQQRAVDTQSTDKKGKRDNIRAGVLSIVGSVYVPGTDERVFEAGDVAALEALEDGGFLRALMDGITRLAERARPEAVEKNSEGGLTGSP